MKYGELKEEVRATYASVRNMDDYRWDLFEDKLVGVHKKSELPIRVRFARNREEAEKMSINKEDYGIDVIIVPERRTFYIDNGAFILSGNFLRSLLVDINDHIVWHGFKVMEKDGSLFQEDFYEYLGGLMVEHIRNNMISGQDYLLWQFYRCEKCGKYVDIDSVLKHMQKHGINLADKSEEVYEVFELNFIKAKVFNKFGKEVKENQFSDEAKSFIKDMFKGIKPLQEDDF